MFSFFKRKGSKPAVIKQEISEPKFKKQAYIQRDSIGLPVGSHKTLTSNYSEARVSDDSSDFLTAAVTAAVVNEIMTPDPVYVSTDSGYSSSSSDYGSSSSDYSGGGGDFGGGGSSGDW